MKQLQKDLDKVKNQFVVDIFNLTQRAMNDIILIQKKFKKLNKGVKIPIRKEK